MTFLLSGFMARTNERKNYSNLLHARSVQKKMADPKSVEVMEMEEVITILDDEDMAEKKKEEANNLYKLKEYQLALPLYTEAIQLQPENASYYGNRSACYIMLGQYQKALEDSKKSIEIDPKFVKGYVRIAKCYIAFGDLTGANSMLSKVQELDPGNAAALSELQNVKAILKFKEDGDKAFRKKDYRKVVYCMDRAIALGVTSANYKMLKAECLAYLGRYEEAQNIAIDVLHSDRQNPDAIYVRGLCLYYGDNNIDRVLTHFQQALKLAPDHSKLMEVYKKAKLLKQKKENGNIAFESSRFKAAYDLYTEALDVDPKNTLMMAKLYYNRATVLSKLGKLREAVADCTSALKMNEKYLKPLLRRAWCHMQLGDYEEAVKDYTKVCELEKNRANERLLHEAKVTLQKSKRKDYYKILGITKSATTNEIKKAYRNRALVHHPDRHANASETEKLEQEKRFKEVGEAYGVLSDPKKRARYDNGQDMEPMDDYMDMNPNRGFDFDGVIFFDGENFTFRGADFGDCF